MGVFRSPDALALDMLVGCHVWDALTWQGEVPLAEHPAWRIIHTVTRQAAGNEALLQELACCWYEHLMDEQGYLEGLLQHGLDLRMALDLALHTGYMDEAQQRVRRRRLEAALQRKDTAEYRHRIQARGLVL